MKRVKRLEVQQKADEKRTERKVQFQDNIVSMNTTWQVVTNFIVNTSHGVAAQGTNTPGLNRLGDTINLRSSSVAVRCSFPRSSDGAATIPGSSTRCRVIFVDNLENIRGLGAADVLQNPVFAFTSPYKASIANGKRYRILGDYKFNLNTNQKADHEFKFKMPISKSGRVVHYDGNGANPSDLNVSMLWCCRDIGPLSPNQPDMFYYVKSSYEDS